MALLVYVEAKRSAGLDTGGGKAHRRPPGGQLVLRREPLRSDRLLESDPHVHRTRPLADKPDLVKWYEPRPLARIAELVPAEMPQPPDLRNAGAGG